MATKLLSRERALDNIRQFGIFDDFLAFNNADQWTQVTAGTTPVVTLLQVEGGVLELETDNEADSVVLIGSTNEVYKVASDKPLFLIAGLKLIQSTAASHTASMVLALSDVITAISPITDAHALAASAYGCGFFKPVGSGPLQVFSTSTAAGFGNVTTTEVSTGTGWEVYALEIEPVSATDKRITFHHGVVSSTGWNHWKQLKDTAGKLISHRWTLTDQAAATAEMHLLFGVKTNGTTAEKLDADFIGCWQLR